MKKVLLIDDLKFTIGCCFGPKSMISIHKNIVTYCEDLLYNSENTHIKEVSDDSKEVFISELNSLNVVSWKNLYINPYILDGDEWALEIVYNDGKKKSITGCNSYPGSRSESNEKTTEFNNLLKALNSLIQKPNYFK
jgi:hypothetical protein